MYSPLRPSKSYRVVGWFGFDSLGFELGLWSEVRNWACQFERKILLIDFYKFCRSIIHYSILAFALQYKIKILNIFD